ncbi:hypothetical protein LCGC14_1156090 [marine sediment metagenome]|uniref:ParB/Sulfiredoxin domain-containing protein n=1 Tax=marine sediment metagenome TaxID=412755 RepID=A0A0F9MH54_9ZZZZ
MKDAKLSELVLDFDLYPRTQIDSHHVSEMVEAENAGTEFPPIVIDKKSKRVIDGFHRVKKHLRCHGPDATIPVVEKTYKNDAAMLLDAIRYNANHGRNLSSFDRMHSILLAGKLGLTDKAVAGALSTTEDRVKVLRLNKSARVGNGKVSVTVPIKQTIRHMAGKKLTRSQVDANKKLGGMNQLFYVNQLLTLIESDLIDKENQDLLEALRKLHERLGETLAVA